MRHSTVLWSCPICGYWKWGTIHNPLHHCPACGQDSDPLDADRLSALETYFCERFHEMNEEERSCRFKVLRA